MAEYKSAYTGPQIDAAIGAVAGKQDLLVSGTNIKTINNLSILGSGNIEIEGGGGDTDFNVRVIDATDPDEWDSEEDMPSQAVFEDITANDYQAIRLINVPIDGEGGTYELDMFITGIINIEGYRIREYTKIDSGDEDEEQPPFIQLFTFTKEGDDPTTFEVSQISLDTPTVDNPVYFETIQNMVSPTRVTLDLESITAAINADKEVILKLPVFSSQPYVRYFRIETTPSTPTYFPNYNDPLWTPTFVCRTEDNVLYMVFDELYDGNFYFNIYETAKKYQPDYIDKANNTISFDVDIYSYLYNEKPENIKVNLDENNGEDWVEFHNSYFDDTQNTETLWFTSDPIPTVSQGVVTLTVYSISVGMNGGNLETYIYTNTI